LIAFFSSIVLRCLGAATIVASTIWPFIARKPVAFRASSKRRKRASTASAFFRASPRNVQISCWRLERDRRGRPPESA
jgi:hypothetical protein